jgi:hypothetical protein
MLTAKGSTTRFLRFKIEALLKVIRDSIPRRISGRPLPPRTCPHCGRDPDDYLTYEVTQPRSHLTYELTRPRSHKRVLKLVK